MTHLPLPYLSLSFETIEARIWAKETVDNVFTESTPKDTLLDYNDLADIEVISVNTEMISYTPRQRSRRHTVSSTASSMTTVSTSSMSSAIINDLPATPEDDYHDPQQGSPVSNSSGSSLHEPSSPRRLSRRSSITSSLKRRLTMDESTSINVRRLFLSEQLQKEQKAHSMWQDTLHEYLLDPGFQIPTPRFTVDSPRLAHYIVSELLSTEETYLDHLSMFQQSFIDPFIQRFQNRNMTRDLQTIFSHIPQLISLSLTLVQRWRTLLQRQVCCMYDDDGIISNNKHQDIGKAFCDLEDEFKVYIYYAVHYAKAQKCIVRMEQKPSYQQWMHVVLQNKELQRMELADYLIAPIQRVTRYCLLIKDLSKHTAGQTMELERALKHLTALAVAMNNCQQ